MTQLSLVEVAYSVVSVNVHVDLCVVPMGVGVSVSRFVVVCQEVLGEYGLTHQMHAYGTNIEGEYETVFKAVKTCHERLHEMGVPRISTSIKLGTRVDREQTLEDKISSVTSKQAAKS